MRIGSILKNSKRTFEPIAISKRASHEYALSNGRLEVDRYHMKSRPINRVGSLGRWRSWFYQETRYGFLELRGLAILAQRLWLLNRPF